MYNATEYRKQNLKGDEKRINCFLSTELTPEERSTVQSKRGAGHTYMSAEIFEKFKTWFNRPDKRYKNANL